MKNFWSGVSGLVGILALGQFLFSPCVNGQDVYNLTVKLTLDSNPEEILWTLYDIYAGKAILQGAGADYNAYEELTFWLQLNDSCYWLEFNDTEDWENADEDGTYGWYEMSLNGEPVTHGVQGIGNHSFGLYGIFTFCVGFFDVPQGGISIALYDPPNMLYLDTYNYYGEILIIDDNWYYYEWATIFFNPDKQDEVISTQFSIEDGCYYMIFYSYEDYGEDYWYGVKVNNQTIISSDESAGDTSTYINFCTNNTGNSKYNYKYVEQDCTNIGDDDDTIEFQFNIKFDNWPEEVSWNLINEHSGDIIVSGDGEDIYDYSEIWHANCIPSGCYHFEIYDSWGDGMYHWWDDYGWFRVYLDGKEISLGKQAVENDGLSLYFCTNFFVGGENSLTIDTKYNDTLFKIYDNDGSPLFYKNDFIIPYFMRYVDGYSQSEAVLDITCGCYEIESTNPFSIITNDNEKLQFISTESSSSDSEDSNEDSSGGGKGESNEDSDSEESESESESDERGGNDYVWLTSTCVTVTNDDGECGSANSSNNSNNSDSSSAIAAIVVIIIIVICCGVLAIVFLRARDKKQQELEQQRGGPKATLNDQLQEEPMKQGAGTTSGGGAATNASSGATSGGWDMGTLGGNDDEPAKDDDGLPDTLSGDPTPR